MNTQDSPQNTALLNRLILLVLSLILVCLVLLVVRAYTKPGGGGERAAVTESPAAEEPAPVIVQSTPLPRPPPPMRRPVVEAAAPVEATPPPQQPAVNSADEPASQAVPVFPVVAGASVPRITITEGGTAGSVSSGLEHLEIFGTATLVGTPRPEMVLDLGPTCGRINPARVTTRHFVVSAEGGLANVFVYLSHGVRKRFAPPSQRETLDQVGCMFQPYVLGLQTEQPLLIRNSDPEMHNVHATPRVQGNEEFNFAQLRGQSNVKRFAQPEVLLRIKCDVHPWMFAYIGVVEHPFFSVTDTNGNFQLPAGLPGGRYTLTATHLKAGTLSQEIDFRRGEQKPVHFQFTVPAALQTTRTAAQRPR